MEIQNSITKNSSQANLLEDLKFKCSYRWKEWIRLKETWDAVSTLQLALQKNSEHLENMVSEENSYRYFASDIQNRQLRLRALEMNASKGREVVRTARYRLNVAISENNKLTEHYKLEEGMVQSLSANIYDQTEGNCKFMSELKKTRNELIFRRCYMLKQLYETFFPKIMNCSRALVFKKQCLCLKFDVIHGLHFPTVAARLGHNVNELNAAAGFVVQLLLSISRILAFPLKHFVIFNGSRCLILNRGKLQCYELYSSSAKNNRNRIDEAMQLLNDNVIQLRTESGVVSREIDRPIRLLQELLLSYMGNHRFSHSELLVPVNKFSNSALPSLSAYISVNPNKLTEESNLYKLVLNLPSICYNL